MVRFLMNWRRFDAFGDELNRLLPGQWRSSLGVVYCDDIELLVLELVSQCGNVVLTNYWSVRLIA